MAGVKHAEHAYFYSARSVSDDKRRSTYRRLTGWEESSDISPPRLAQPASEAGFRDFSRPQLGGGD
jgi:hypothetical protein